MAVNGAGVVSLINSGNSYSGGNTIAGGILQASYLANGGNNSSIGASSSAAANLLLTSGGTLQYIGSGNATTDRLFTLGNGGGVLRSSGSGTLNFTNTGAIGFSAATPVTLSLMAATPDQQPLGKYRQQRRDGHFAAQERQWDLAVGQ